jgi:hypothetical protein
MNQILLQYLHANHSNGFGMATTATLPIMIGDVTGNIQLKWWKQQGALIIKEIQIHPLGRNLLTPAVTSVLSNSSAISQGLQTVVLESVLSPELRKKLISRGWKSVSYNEYNLFMDRLHLF